MNILLLDGLPYDYEGVPLSADFRNMINADLILHDPDIPDDEKSFLARHQLYETMPEDTQQAMDGFTWFFACGRKGEESGKAKKPQKKSFDFDQDANFIYAAFYATYNINLATIDFLHWWEFMALFEGLPESTLIKQIMYYRTADTSQMSKTERKHAEKMRNLFPLKSHEKEPLSIEELNQRTKDRVARRIAEVNRMLAGK